MSEKLFLAFFQSTFFRRLFAEYDFKCNKIVTQCNILQNRLLIIIIIMQIVINFTKPSKN